MAEAKKNNDDLSLQSLIKVGDSLVDDIIQNKTIKSHYDKEEGGNW